VCEVTAECSIIRSEIVVVMRECVCVMTTEGGIINTETNVRMHL
jgi:hypothetical protein